jgi:hypothetical protein
MTDTPIPDDVMNLAREATEAGNTDPEWFLAGTREKYIARAILADRAAQAKRVEELEEVLRDFERNATAWMKPPRAGVPSWMERCVKSARAALGGKADA